MDERQACSVPRGLWQPVIGTAGPHGAQCDACSTGQWHPGRSYPADNCSIELDVDDTVFDVPDEPYDMR